MSFTDQVYAVVKKIPQGETMTYKQVAAAAGSPNAFRAVGNILNKNTDKSIPCHRVVKSDGALGGYNGLQGSKKNLLEREKLSSKRS